MNAQKEDIMLLKGIEMLFTQPFKSVWLIWVYFLLKSVFVYTVKVNKVPCCFRTISWCFSGLKQFWDKNNTCFGFLRSQSVIQALPKTNGLGSLHHGASLRTALLTCLSVCSFLSIQAEIQTHIQNSCLWLTLELMHERKNYNGER